jgi:alginate O-acetyltransferase complex protein AlgI
MGILMLGVSEALSVGIAGQGIDAAFARTDYHWTAIDVWIITIGYGFQLFFNFAGYSHIVIGAARFFGFELPENFNRPFLATTPAMFWNRWHMSLSSWIRDYLFLPMATRWRSLWWRNLALLISMILFGLWHGATFLFVLWGTYHGVLLVLHRLGQQVRIRLMLPRAADGVIALFSWCFTFGAVSVGWVLFRAEGWQQAQVMLRALVDWSSYSFSTSTLSMACKLLIVLTGAAYFTVVGISNLLDRAASTSESGRYLPAALQLISNERWVWVSPLVAVLAIYGWILVGHVGKVGSPLLYRLF